MMNTMTTRRMLGERGFTLMELLVSLLISTIGLVAVFSFFVMQDRSARNQQATSEVQQNARVASEFLTRDIRSAGFGIGGGNAVRIEQACGKNPMTPPGVNDHCPNGSDRITLHYRLTNTRLFGCDPAVCPANVGAKLVFLQPNLICPGEPGPCGTSLHPDLYCGATFSPAKAISFCSPEGMPCANIRIDAVKCDVGCGGGLGNDCTQISFASPPASAMTAVGQVGRQGSPQIDVVRTYQLMDLNSDGATELVFSDTVIGSASSTLTASQLYSVVAENIDDLQFEVNSNGDSVDFRSANCTTTDCWFSRDIYWAQEDNNGSFTTTDADYPFNFSATARQGANDSYPASSAGAIRAACQNLGRGRNGVAGEGSMEGSPVLPNNSTWGCSSRVRAVKFQLAARTAVRQFKGDRTLMEVGYHPQLGNNPQVQVPFNPNVSSLTAGQAVCWPFSTSTNCLCGAPPTAGEAAVNVFDRYARCSQSGNAQGYRWRVMTNEVLMRNVLCSGC